MAPWQDTARQLETKDGPKNFGKPLPPTDTLKHANIARFRYESGDIDDAVRIALEALDQGDAAYPYNGTGRVWAKLWPHGIEPNGSPTPYPQDDAWPLPPS